MYRLLGDVVIDTEEFIEQLRQKGIRVVQDISNGTKRDDAIGLRVLVSLEDLGVAVEEMDEEQMEAWMQKAELLSNEQFQVALDGNLAHRLYAYRYDEMQGIVLNVAIMDWEIGRRKLDDVLKRLFDV